MHPTRLRERLRITLLLYLVVGLMFVIASVAVVYLVDSRLRREALAGAEAKALLLLERNLAIHAYFAHELKPAVFQVTDKYLGPDYFEPAWMSSTYAVREIDKYFHNLVDSDTYYKEVAINARSPQNEADAHERAFLEELKADPLLTERSEIREFDDQLYYVTMRRGETMEASCLRCHSTPDQAPGDLVALYGSERSFNRQEGELVSAISIRIPISEAYESNSRVTRQLSAFLVLVFGVLTIGQLAIYHQLLFRPLDAMRAKALQIAGDPRRLGEQVITPMGKEMADLATALNTMSTNLKSAQEHLVRREKLAFLGQLTGGISHELRTPLMVITQGVYLLQSELPESQQEAHETLDVIERQTAEATRIITNLLDFSRTNTASRQPTSLEKQLNLVLPHLSVPDNVTLQTDFQADLPLAWVDPGHVRQVLSNLISNACQAMPNGGLLTVRAVQKGEWVALSVQDTGHGIPNEVLPRLFDPLFTTRADGIGLGLVLCKLLVESNDGSIDVATQVGQGSTFTVTLPVRQEKEV